MLIQIAQILTPKEIEQTDAIFEKVFKIKPKIKMEDYDVAFYQKGIKLFLRIKKDKKGLLSMEIREFTLPGRLRNKGLGTEFFRSFLYEFYYPKGRFTKIWLYPLNNKAFRFWKRLGFNYLGKSKPYLFYSSSRNSLFTNNI